MYWLRIGTHLLQLPLLLLQLRSKLLVQLSQIVAAQACLSNLQHSSMHSDACITTWSKHMWYFWEATHICSSSRTFESMWGNKAAATHASFIKLAAAPAGLTQRQAQLLTDS
jgi:hypothetical protein